MSETTEITDAIQSMNRARVIIGDDRRIKAELRERIEQQRALITVARGYIQSGRPDLAALVLTDDLSVIKSEGGV